MAVSDPTDRHVNRQVHEPGSLRRGLALLSCLGREGRPIGLSELAAVSGLDKATVHRLARTLVESGYLTQDPDTRSYSLGLRVLDLGFATLATLDVRQLALPYMRALAAQFDRASVSMSVLDGTDAIYIERISQRRISVNVDVQVGSRIPAHCTSMGKALLAALPVAESRALVRQRPLEAWTSRTLTSVTRLEAELKHVRSVGYAVNDEETALGLRSLAAAVRDADGRPAAALNVAMAAAEVSLSELVDAVAPAVVEAAANISRHLGLSGAAAAGDRQQRAEAVAR
jgi:IclR family pca regulon transcriptional regulator